MMQCAYHCVIDFRFLGRARSVLGAFWCVIQRRLSADVGYVVALLMVTTDSQGRLCYSSRFPFDLCSCHGTRCRHRISNARAVGRRSPPRERGSIVRLLV